MWGRLGSGRGEFRSPIGIAVGPRDELFVTDLHNARVQRFSADGDWLSELALPRDMPSRDSMSASAAGIAVDSDGLLYLALSLSHRMLVLTDSGETVRTWGERGTAPGQFDEPGGVAVDEGGTVFVADQVNRRVQVFTRHGDFLRSWGGYGTEAGRFDGIEPGNSRFGGPHFVALDGRGHVFTTEGALGRVQKWTNEGTAAAAWGDKTDGPGGFGGLETPFSKNTFGPIGVCTDRAGHVWVSSLNGRVQSFTQDGEFLVGTGSRGSAPGQFLTPHAMVVDSRGHLYVVDSGNQRIQKFDLGNV